MTVNSVIVLFCVISANSGSFNALCVKVHIRYLISWWVLVLELWLQIYCHVFLWITVYIQCGSPALVDELNEGETGVFLQWILPLLWAQQHHQLNDRRALLQCHQTSTHITTLVHTHQQYTENYQHLFTHINDCVSSVLWCCCMDDRNTIRPVENVLWKSQQWQTCDKTWCICKM